ncbi:MAG: hypothetical protein WAM82_22925 [Thermoanaerobaculia bacterium]
MDKDLITYLDERFRESAQQLASFREETNGRFEETNGRIERVEEGVRHTQVMVEGLRGDVQLLAEKMGTFDEKLVAHRSELRKEIGEVKTLLHLSYGDLNRRIG